MYTKVTEDCDDFGFALSELGMGDGGKGGIVFYQVYFMTFYLTHRVII